MVRKQKSNKVARRPYYGGGRAKLYDFDVTVPVSFDTLARIDAARVGDETRLAVIRAAIEAELERRSRRP